MWGRGVELVHGDAERLACVLVVATWAHSIHLCYGLQCVLLVVCPGVSECCLSRVTRLLASGSQLEGAICTVHIPAETLCMLPSSAVEVVCLFTDVVLASCWARGRMVLVSMCARVCLCVCVCTPCAVHSPGSGRPTRTRGNVRQGVGCARSCMFAGLRQQHVSWRVVLRPAQLLACRGCMYACVWEPHCTLLLWGMPALLATVVHRKQLANSQCWVIALGRWLRHMHCGGCSSSRSS
jgi:hypothetical protein